MGCPGRWNVLGCQNLELLLVSYWPLAAGFQTLARAEKVHTHRVFGAKGTLPARVDKESFLGRGTNDRQLGLHWRCTGIYFVFGMNGYLVGLVSLQQ